MAIRVYNTQTKQKEDFVTLVPNECKIYLCGPTVYDFLHIGNFRGAVVFNLIRNWLEHRGYKVTFVYNYTDVDDKIIKRANDEKVDAKVIADKYIEEFERDFNSLGLRKHDHNPRVSDFIGPIVEIVEKLVANGKAYVVNGEVLYSVRSFAEYGKLSGKSIDELQSGARVEIDSKKRDPLDFALWKPAKPGEPSWPSPWGAGRPGWHIECSAMSSKILGDSFDIHGGGIDLIFPHHENEIAQSEGASGKKLANYWVHNNFINFGAHKMSKSLGNLVTARAFISKYNPEILKYLLLMAHYRSHSDFSESQISNAISALARVYSAMGLAETLAAGQTGSGKNPGFLEDAFKKADEGIGTALDDDFNTPEMFARIFDMVRIFNTNYRLGMKMSADHVTGAQNFISWIKSKGKMMSLYQEPAREFLITLDDMLLEEKKLKRSEVDVLVGERTQVRLHKDFKRSDEIRDKLKSMGIAVHDTVAGTVWEVQK